MNCKRKTRRRRGEQGIALLIAIFVLLLISVVAISLLLSSGTETALGVNYRSSSTSYYAALAGLEEVRGRMLPSNPNSLSAILPPTLPLGQTIYVINRQPGETVAPWDPSNLYYDHEYKTEFGQEASSTSWQSQYSVWDNNAQGIPGPLFKWVRINGVTEVSLHTDVNYDSYFDPATLLFYDPANTDLSGNSWPSLIVSTSPPSTAVQVLEITALAYLPNGSKKILQYVVAPTTMNLSFPAALTLDGFSDAFSGSTHNIFHVSGNGDSGDGACGTPSIPYPVPAIGVSDSADASNISGGLSRPNNYTGSTSSPSVSQVTVPANLQTPQALDSIVQTIIKNADSVIQGPATQSNLPSAMSTGNTMMTVAIAGDPAQPSQGNITLSGGYTGYGLLLVTGTLTYDPDVSWNGIILVVGQGKVVSTSSGSTGQINGAVLVAQTRDLSGNLLGSMGAANVNLSNSRANGIYYNCSWIAAAEAPLTYKVLSFHEIPQ